jgi:LmbE family N-acetylglucosaminyl deacetylase
MEETLLSHALQANALLGVKELFFESLPNRGIDTLPIIDVTQTIERYIARLRPQRVFTHHIGDINKDHQVIAEATFTATRPICGQGVKEVYSYNVPSSTEWNMIEGEKVFVPNLFIDITATVDTKIEAMCCYKSECRPYPHPRSPEALRIHANYWGVISGFEYAEPFKLIRKIGELA